MATPLKGRFVVFSQKLLISYFRLGYVRLGDAPQGKAIGPAGSRSRRKVTVKLQKNAPKRRCH